MTSELTYDNRTGRPPGPLVRSLGLVWRGVRDVRAQADPYAAVWAAHNREVIAGTRRRLVVLGDSMAQGVGASRPEQGWAGQLHSRLVASGHELDLLNLSATGARVPDVLEQQVPVLEAFGGTDPLVLVLIGSNDLFGRRQHREGLPAAMAELVRRLPDGSVVATLPQPRGAAQEANTFIEAAAAAGRLHAVDLRSTGPDSWKGMLAADFFHPNDRGYAALADAFEPVVRRVLARSGDAHA